MKAVMVMYDSLRRDMLSPYGGSGEEYPNFARLAQHTVAFDNSYSSSLPCMPARREIHTGRANFLHRGWGPLEPFDDSMPEILSDAGIYTRLVTDHYHYVEDGGATYHSRYDSWDCIRGQEGDTYRGSAKPFVRMSPHMFGLENAVERLRRMRQKSGLQNQVNRGYQNTIEDYPQYKTFAEGLEFIENNSCYDNWFLQLETFDPHEPFDAPKKYKGMYFDPDDENELDWPPYAKVHESKEIVQVVTTSYKALIKFCDDSLGKVLDVFDRLNLWEDTMLIVNTDHGFLLGEHDWWSKASMPDYNEVVHTPLYIWDPENKACGVRRNSLVQTIDLAPTLLDFFGIEIPKDMLGKSLRETIKNNKKVREYGILGYMGGPLNVTDGRYLYMLAPKAGNVPCYEYTLMPTRMRHPMTPDELKDMQLIPSFSFTKGCPVLKIPAFRIYEGKMPFGTSVIYDLKNDPKQEHPYQDEEMAKIFKEWIRKLLVENDAPKEVYGRYL